MLSDIAQDHVGRHRRHLIEPRLAELAFHVVFGGKAEPAVKLQAGVGGFPRRIRGQQLVDATLTTIADDTEPGNLRSVADVELNGAIITENNPDVVFEPSDFYEYEAEAAGSELIATIESEAGTR
jgi:hypothetical protein